MWCSLAIMLVEEDVKNHEAAAEQVAVVRQCKVTAEVMVVEAEELELGLFVKFYRVTVVMATAIVPLEAKDVAVVPFMAKAAAGEPFEAKDVAKATFMARVMAIALVIVKDAPMVPFMATDIASSVVKAAAMLTFMSTAVEPFVVKAAAVLTFMAMAIALVEVKVAAMVEFMVKATAIAPFMARFTSIIMAIVMVVGHTGFTITVNITAELEAADEPTAATAEAKAASAPKAMFALLVLVITGWAAESSIAYVALATAKTFVTFVLLATAVSAIAYELLATTIAVKCPIVAPESVCFNRSTKMAVMSSWAGRQSAEVLRARARESKQSTEAARAR